MVGRVPCNAARWVTGKQFASMLEMADGSTEIATLGDAEAVVTVVPANQGRGEPAARQPGLAKRSMPRHRLPRATFARRAAGSR